MVLFYLNTQIVKLSAGKDKFALNVHLKHFQKVQRVNTNSLVTTIRKGKFAVNSREKRIIE